MSASTPHVKTLPKPSAIPRGSPTPSLCSERSKATVPGKANSMPSFIDLTTEPTTPPSLGSRPIPTRQTKSDERHSRSKRSIQSSGSPARQRKRRAHSGIPSSTTANLSPDIDYPLLGHIRNDFDQPNNEPASPSNRLSSPESEPNKPANDNEPVQKIRTAKEVHQEVRRKLREDITGSDNKKGFVYILRDPKRPHLVKIGKSINTGQRREQIVRDCAVGVEEVYVSEEVDSHLRTEQLAHADLWHLLIPYWCAKCGRVHREWHKVEEKLAIETVERWVKFMQRRPYTAAGKLRPIWDHLLGKRQLPQRADVDHEIRWQHWGNVLSPPRHLDYCEQIFGPYLEPCWVFLCTFSWQLSTTLSWTVLFLSFRNFASLFFLLISVFCSWAHLLTFDISKKSKK